VLCIGVLGEQECVLCIGV